MYPFSQQYMNQIKNPLSSRQPLLVDLIWHTTWHYSPWIHLGNSASFKDLIFTWTDLWNLQLPKNRPSKLPIFDSPSLFWLVALKCDVQPRNNAKDGMGREDRQPVCKRSSSGLAVRFPKDQLFTKSSKNAMHLNRGHLDGNTGLVYIISNPSMVAIGRSKGF